MRRNVAAAMNINPALSVAGTSWVKGAGGVAAVVEFGVPLPAPKPGKEKNAVYAGDNPRSWYLGPCGAKASEDAVRPEVGFVFPATVGGGTYPSDRGAATVSAGITNGANNGNLISGCDAGPVDQIGIASLDGQVTL